MDLPWSLTLRTQRNAVWKCMYITVYMPYNVWQCLFSHTHGSTNYPKRYEMIFCYVVKTLISLILRGVEYVYLCLEDICISFFLTCLFKFFAYFLLAHWFFSNYFKISHICLYFEEISRWSMIVVLKVWFLD